MTTIEQLNQINSAISNEIRCQLQKINSYNDGTKSTYKLYEKRMDSLVKAQEEINKAITCSEVLDNDDD